MKNTKLSIVTPCYNTGKYIEHTLKSVLSQDYNNYEYFVIDGGSTDNTVEILKKYSKDRKYRNKFQFISEPDEGQTDAINKGLELSTGNWFAWINADDFYEPNMFSKLIKAFDENPDAGVIYGNCYAVGTDNKKIQLDKPPGNVDFDMLKEGNPIYGQSSFFNMVALKEVGKFNINLDYWMDYEMYLRISRIMKFKYIDMNIANFRIRPNQKSRDQNNLKKIQRERKKIKRRYDKRLYIEPVLKMKHFFFITLPLFLKRSKKH